MTFVRKSYTEITDSILSQITRGVVNEKQDYVRNRSKYRLAYPNVYDIVKIEGIVKGAAFVFRKGTDYKLGDNMVEWLGGGEKPDHGTPFFVNYMMDAPGGITDINPGSVTRTIIESVAMELDYLYAQMNQVYNSAFIDTANGKSLDMVAALLGVNRKMAGYATGEVTFGRKSEPATIEVSRETHVYDGKDRYELKNPMLKAVKSVEGTLEGANAGFEQGKDYLISEGKLIWIPAGKKPDKGSVFYVDYAAYETITIPIDTRVSTYSRRPENVKVFRTVEQSVLTRNAEGRWEVEVPVMALTPGKEGNVFAGSINMMPKPLVGIEYVINKKDILNGTEAENDNELRERAKRALEMAGKATIKSLKSAVQGIEGVTGNVVVIDQPDGVPGIVQIIASGGDEEEIEKVIGETRSAGIKVEFKRPIIIPLDVKLTIVVVENVDRNEVKNEVESIIRQYLGGLEIGEDVIMSRIIKAALSPRGIRDARDVTINDKKENIDVMPHEKGELRTLEIYVED
ncbi:hypothetical protein CUJ83_04895 [Methanocella sp. CWC-04]|uniref:Baseplate J-like protein n=1 Tax=Methanooceanicella nereidis TaxID=2052831 RepID=A0AAP2RCX6_9EURY|nr:baseplate J/gp47 family protein [Methanocella sp. CWC-04]MCD1294335.1 hypothetical protein [Methanocella sp. CWC-04]